LHKKVYAMWRTLSDPFYVVNEGSFTLEKTIESDNESSDLRVVSLR
jgi:hypothetical protein